MTNDRPTRSAADTSRFVADVESQLGRRLTDPERTLALSLIDDKSAPVVARELAGSPIADPKKIRPEHSDTADESAPTTSDDRAAARGFGTTD